MTTDLEKLRRAFAVMDDTDRAVFARARFDDLTYPEIAADLGITVSEVEDRMVSAIRHLRDALEAP